MKYIKILSLLAIAAAALMALAGSALATTITAGGSTYSTTGEISATAEGHVVLDNPIAKIECASGVETKKALTHGSGITASAGINILEFFNCTNSWHVTVISAGSLEIHSIGSGDGTLTSSGATVESTRFGITCRYSTNGTDIGTLTDGTHATLDISAAIPFHSGSGLCGSGATTWTGSYNVTTPTNLSIDP
jgi:hypothetical protein